MPVVWTTLQLDVGMGFGAVVGGDEASAVGVVRARRALVSAAFS